MNPPANAEHPDPGLALASRRLWIVMGKGGTGRTTLAASLGVVAARSGLRTLVVGASGEDSLGVLFDADGRSGSERDPLEVDRDLWLARIEPEDALAEYLELYLPLGRLGSLLLRNRAFRKFLDAAPGWRDLVTLGKIWNLEQQKDRGGRPRFDAIVVDAPATGHGLSFLSVPQVVIDAVGVGPLRRQTQEIQRMLVDARRTACLIVALAEELPVQETLELRTHLDRLAIPLGPLFVNRVEPSFELDVARVRAALERRASDDAPSLAEPRALLDAVEHRARRAALQAHWIRTLESGAGRASLRVPYLIDPIESRSGIERLADRLVPVLARCAA